MSAATPTIVPRTPVFPTLLPKPLQPHPLPLPLEGQRRFRMNAIRDRNKEMADLSEEEREFNEMKDEVRNRGQSFLIPIGRHLTQNEEKNDAEASEEEEVDDDDVSDNSTPSEEQSEEAGEEDEDEEEDEEEHDLDADMEDMDEAGNTTVETDDMDAEDTRDADASPDP